MTWGGLKKGDKALLVFCIGERGERVETVIVKSVGKKWIKTVNVHGYDERKFYADTGHGEYGYSVHTKKTLADAHERREAILEIRSANIWALKTPTLRSIRALIKEDQST